MMFLSRHADADWASDAVDPPLSAVGVRCAERMASHCQRLSITILRTSPLRRARLTAELIGRQTSAALVIDDTLREFDGLGPRDVWETQQLDLWRVRRPAKGELWVTHGGVLGAIWMAWGLATPSRGPVDRHGSLVACGEIWAVRGTHAGQVTS